MTRLFDITTTHDSIELDAQGKGKVVFTVTNATTAPQRAMFKLRALDSGQAGWLSLAGEAERDFSPGMVHQVEVAIAMPADAAERRFRMRLDALSAANPEEHFVESQLVSVSAPAPKVAPPSPGMPKWVWLVVALVVLAIAGVVGYLLMRKKTPTDPPKPDPVASAPAEPQPPRPQPVATKDFDNPQVQVAGGRMVWLDVCHDWGTNCGPPAANAFCRSQGLGVAQDFKITPDAPPTGVIGTKQLCDGAFCDRISWVRCAPAQTRVILNAQTLRYLKEAQVRGKQIVLPE